MELALTRAPPRGIEAALAEVGRAVGREQQHGGGTRAVLRMLHKGRRQRPLPLPRPTTARGQVRVIRDARAVLEQLKQPNGRGVRGFTEPRFEAAAYALEFWPRRVQVLVREAVHARGQR